MKKMIAIRMVALLLTIAMILPLVGCNKSIGSEAEEESTTIKTEQTTASTVVTQSTEETTIKVEEEPTETTNSTETTEASEIEETEAIPKENEIIEVEPEKEENVTQEDEIGMTQQQKNSFSMLYYLAITAEKIRISKDNRLMLQDIYDSLMNDTNPGAIDELTQAHLENLRDIISDYIDTSVKRDRLQYIYNQNKAVAIRSAVPNPIAVLSMTKSFNWRQLATSVSYTVIDSYSNYKGAVDSAEQNFIMSGWELDDEETETIRKNRERAFDYMVDIVQEYQLDGKKTLNEIAIKNFAEICTIESVHQKISRLEAENETYKLLGDYWLELADCYFEISKYRKCLDCVDRYVDLSTGIYRQDGNYAKILPKAIVAAQNTYHGDTYVSEIQGYVEDIVENTLNSDWSIRYFAAQVYLDMYSKTDSREYLNKAYDLIYNNVTFLISEQEKLNDTYENSIVEKTVEEPDYRFMSDKEKKQAEKEYKEEVKKLKAYNKELKKVRETELLSMYEPFILNCDLLFELAEKRKIVKSEKEKIEGVLETQNSGVFIVKPINDYYSFSKKTAGYDIKFDGDKIVIPANLLTTNSKITISAIDDYKTTVFDDWVIAEVIRNGDTIDTFNAHITSPKMDEYKWTPESRVDVKIVNCDENNPLVFKYKVTEYKENWLFGDKVVFEKE